MLLASGKPDFDTRSMQQAPGSGPSCLGAERGRRVPLSGTGEAERMEYRGQCIGWPQALGVVLLLKFGFASQGGGGGDWPCESDWWPPPEAQLHLAIITSRMLSP